MNKLIDIDVLCKHYRRGLVPTVKFIVEFIKKFLELSEKELQVLADRMVRANKEGDSGE